MPLWPFVLLLLLFFGWVCYCCGHAAGLVDADTERWRAGGDEE